MARHGVTVAGTEIDLTDPAADVLPDVGWVRLTDPETGIRAAVAALPGYDVSIMGERQNRPPGADGR